MIGHSTDLPVVLSVMVTVRFVDIIEDSLEQNSLAPSWLSTAGRIFSSPTYRYTYSREAICRCAYKSQMSPARANAKRLRTQQ